MVQVSSSRPVKMQRPITSTSASSRLLTTVVMLVLLALTSPVSQATIAPVYGAVPASVNHKEALIFSFSLGFLIDRFLGPLSPEGQGIVLQRLGIWACWIPVIQSQMYSYSATLGIVGGPITHGLISCHSLLIPGSRVFASMTRLGRTLPGQILSVSVAAAGLVIFIVLESTFARYLPELALYWNDTSISYSPIALQVVIAVFILLLSTLHPQKLRSWDWRWCLIIPALLHTLFQNQHVGSIKSTSNLAATLMSRDWILLDRRWSTTGYLSVLDNIQTGFRVLRCDHSLLGGEWLLTLERRKNDGWKVTEPIYSVFAMLEAVRLIENGHTVADVDAKALVIGLGSGTAPTAFVAHGIDTTIVELDPVVHEFSIKYFDLPRNHTAVLRDAISWTAEAVTASPQQHPRYHYILHDVFTGGAEPLELFTDTFITRLRQLLMPKGVIALNYAGDLGLTLTRRVLHTIDVVFDGQCRAFRDSAPPTSSASASPEVDFVNLVVFCRNEPGGITFRRPVAADFLHSKSREQYLLPSPEREIALPDRDDPLMAPVIDSELGQWRQQQVESATRHWAIMRTVLPDFVWELW